MRVLDSDGKVYRERLYDRVGGPKLSNICDAECAVGDTCAGQDGYERQAGDDDDGWGFS